MKTRKHAAHKVGSSWITTRKVNGKRQRVRVTKKSRSKYSVKKVK